MDEVGGAVYQVQDAVDGVIPVVEQVLFVFCWAKVEGVVDAVDAAADDLLVVQVADFFLAIVLLNS